MVICIEISKHRKLKKPRLRGLICGVVVDWPSMMGLGSGVYDNTAGVWG